MGRIVEFPQGRRVQTQGRVVSPNDEPTHIIILPIVRVERHPDEPDEFVKKPPSRRRRKSRRDV